MTATAMELAERALSRVAGLRVDPALRGRLQRCLAETAAAGNEAVPVFAGRLASDGAAVQALIDRVTVQETWFFRDEAQFDALAQHVLPAAGEGQVTIWCAASAYGQEAYSLAMVLADSDVRGWRVVASDISSNALARTRAGRYTERGLRGLNEDRRRRFLRRAGHEWEIAPQLRERVTVMHHNLVAGPPPAAVRGCTATFCRNVLIYLRPGDISTVACHLAGVLESGRHLFLGSSETLTGVEADFRLERLGDAFVYRRLQAGRTGPRRPRHEARRAHVQITKVTAVPQPATLLAQGERALAADDSRTAIRSFRQATFLDGDNPLAHASLGLALESAGEPAAARRAFAAAQAALRRGSVPDLGPLRGFAHDGLAALLRARLGAA